MPQTQSQSQSQSQSFNVVQIIADQHNAGLLGCAGHPQVSTPHLDTLAAGGTRFDAAYTQNILCTPSRTSILSGQYCHNHGYYGLSGPRPTALPSFMGHFRDHGYRTAGFGKLHLPNSPRNWLSEDLDRFGDTYERVEISEEGSEYFDYLSERGLREFEDSFHNPWRYGKGTISMDARPSDMPYEHTQEVWSARQALEFIDAEPGRPFCVQVSLQKPHHPLLPQQQFWDRYPDDLDLPPTFGELPSGRPPHFAAQWRETRAIDWDYAAPGDGPDDGPRRAWRGYLACISQVDDVVGMLVRGLSERNLSDRTVVLYHSDHGGYHGIHGIAEKAPGICSEEVCRIPMIWSVPGLTDGSVSTALVENVDIAPTLSALCGLPPMETADGRDLTGLLPTGDGAPVRDTAVTENPWSKSLRWGDWRFVHYQNEMFGGRDLGELYNLADDPEETANLYHDAGHQAVVHQCRDRLLQWLIGTTRVRTCWPVPGRPMHREPYPIAGDGYEARSRGPAARLRRGEINYL